MDLNLATLEALSLSQWRRSKSTPGRFDPWRVWEPLRPMFASRGVDLFVPCRPGPEDFGMVMPRGGERRSYDGTYSVYEGDVRQHCQHVVSRSSQLPRMIRIVRLIAKFPKKPTHCFARWAHNGRFVLVRLIAKDEEGLPELDILRRVSSRKQAWRGTNHCVRMEREISFQGMVFGVFPLLSEGMDRPECEIVTEVVQVIDQVLEGMLHLHQNGIAHRDIGANNVLMNFAGERLTATEDDDSTFRSLFPVRYHWIDFELSLTFDDETPTSDRVAVGIPTACLGLDHPEDYGRDIAPEMLSTAPHDPFKGDVFQLGKILLYEYHLRSEWPLLVELLDRMASEDAAIRPSASKALSDLRSWVQTLPYEEMEAWVPYPEYPPWNPAAWAKELEEKRERQRERQLAKERAAGAAGQMELLRVTDPAHGDERLGRGLSCIVT